MGRIIPYIMENKKCLKPPTSKISWNNTILRSTSSEQVLRLPADTIWADNLAPALLSELKNNTQLSESLLIRYVYIYICIRCVLHWHIESYWPALFLSHALIPAKQCKTHFSWPANQSRRLTKHLRRRNEKPGRRDGGPASIKIWKQ